MIFYNQTSPRRETQGGFSIKKVSKVSKISCFFCFKKGFLLIFEDE